MPDNEEYHSAGELYSLFQSGFIQSSNFGQLIAGRLTTDIDTGKNSITSRGTVLVSRMGGSYDGEITEFKIEFASGRYIHVYIRATEGGVGLLENLRYNWGFYEADGTPYTFEGRSYGDSPTPFDHDIWDMNPIYETVWSIEPWAVSFFREVTNNQDQTQSVTVGLMITPECYEEGAWYPFDVPIQTIQQRKCDYVTMPFIFADPSLESSTTEAMYQFFEDIITEEVEYDEGDEGNPTGGGGGTYESRNDYMEWPALPSLSVTSTGFVTLYAPTAGQLHSIANWLWSPSFFDNVLKNYSDPFNNILGLFISPITPPTVASVFKVGNVSSEITANKVGNQYMQISCGSVHINPYYNSFADYDNYRSYKIFLPYYGIVDLSTDDFMGGTVAVRYNIDFFTGSATIAIGTTRPNGAQHILHTYATNIFSQIPFSGVNMMNFYNQSIAAASSIISGGIGGNIATMGQGVLGLLNAHPTYGGSRGMGSTAGLMGIQYPYLIECRSIRDMPAGYNVNEGIPLNRVKRVIDLDGYTEFEQIHVKIAGATDDEALEIEKILKEGVLL